jgi:hypothetical protein
MKRLIPLPLLVVLALLACEAESTDPEGVVRQFIGAVERGDEEEVIRLIDPASRNRLEEMARRANAHAGGGKRFRPRDFIAVGQEVPGVPLAGIKKIREGADRSEVELIGEKGGRREVLELLRVKGAWRVVLPSGRSEGPGGAS